MKLQGTLRHGILFIAAVFVLSLFMAGIVHSKDEVKLTPEFLASGKWVIPGVAFEGGPCSGTRNSQRTDILRCSGAASRKARI
jgi:hypothetical protein